MIDKLNTDIVLVCFLKCLVGWWLVIKSWMVSWSRSEECKGVFRISCCSFFFFVAQQLEDVIVEQFIEKFKPFSFIR